METLRGKTRVAVLWIFIAVAMSAHNLFELFGLMKSGGMEEMTEELAIMGPGMMAFFALFWVIPLWMAFISLTVEGSANRWVNLILGILFTIFNTWHFIEHLVPPSPAQILIIGSTVAATALIVWYTWKWSKQE